MITAVMPTAMMPTKAKLRVMLKMFCGFRKFSLSKAMATQAATVAMKIQNTCRETSQPTRPRLVC